MNQSCQYGEHSIGLCPSGEHPATESEHIFGRGFIGADDPRVQVAICTAAHMAVGRTSEAKVNGMWIKLMECKDAAEAFWGKNRDASDILTRHLFSNYVAFILSCKIKGFASFEVIQTWIDAGSLSDAATGRAHQILAAAGLSGE